MSTKVKHLLGDRILVKPDKMPDEIEVGGIIRMTDSTKEVTTGRVVQIGSDVPTTMPIQVGDRVLHSPYSGFAVTLGGAPYKLLTSFEVLAILGEEEVSVE